MKNVVLCAFFFSLFLASSHAQKLTKPLFKGLSHADAIKVCKQRGGRLPTIRELATYYSKTLKAKGIEEVPNNIKGVSIENDSVKNYIKSQASKQFFPIYKKINNVTAVDFFYSRVGASIDHNSELIFIWASDLSPIYHIEGRLTNAYIFFFSRGEITVTDRNRSDDMFSVQCVE